MATNLRNLLGKKVSRETSGASFDKEVDVNGETITDLLPRYPLEGYSTIYITASGGRFDSTRSTFPGDGRDAHHNTYYQDWEIPTGASDVIFELWGGGGAGGGNCCCHNGPPGGSGAYAYKRLMGDEVVPGCKYQICVAGMSERTNSCSGRRGCKSFVIGHNLPTTAVEGYDFCAEGGHGGNGSYCRGCCSDGKVIWARYKCCDANGNPECQDGCCAMYYGADYGAHGLPGYYMPRRDDNRCCNQWGLPYPGGLMNSRGGWINIGQSCRDNSCGACEHSRAASQVGVGGSYCYAYVPGMGGSTSYTCTDSVYCGSNGMPGMVRISWK